MPPILLSAREMAERLEVSYNTLLGWARRGEIPSIRDGRGRRLFNLDSVLTSIRRSSTEAREKAETATSLEGDRP